MYMYFTEATSQPVSVSQDSVDDGLMFRQCVRDRVVDSSASNQQILASDEETEIQDLLTGMDSKERKKMLRYTCMYTLPETVYTCTCTHLHVGVVCCRPLLSSAGFILSSI